MRNPKPWFWKARNTWCVYIGGKKHILGSDKDEAKRKFHQLMGESPKVQPPSADTVAVILDDFLAWTKENQAEKTFRGYKDFCKSFDAMYPTLAIGELSAAHITAWLKEKTTWNPTTKRGAITCMQRSMNWAVQNRGLRSNPIRGMKKPKAKNRITVISEDEFNAILANVKDAAFQELLLVAYDCGARPQEVKEMEARHVDLEKQRATLPTHEAKGERKPRVIYFPTDRTMAILRRLVAEHPTGMLFRNSRGRPWTASAVKCRFDRLEDVLGKRYRQYDFRHTWITRKLLAGVDSHIVAALAGHASTEQLDRTYSHVADDPKFMLDAAKK